MAERDEFDEKAERLLLDVGIASKVRLPQDDIDLVLRSAIPAVAAELRAAGKEIERLRFMNRSQESEIGNREKEIADLRNLRDWWQDKAENYRSEIADLRAEHTKMAEDFERAMTLYDKACKKIDQFKTAWEQSNAMLHTISADNDQLRAQLVEAEKRGMERAIQINAGIQR